MFGRGGRINLLLGVYQPETAFWATSKAKARSHRLPHLLLRAPLQDRFFAMELSSMQAPATLLSLADRASAAEALLGLTAHYNRSEEITQPGR